MAKSAGNFFTIRDLLERGFGGLEIRYVLLSAHYRSSFNFSFDGLAAAREALRYLREFRVNARAAPSTANGHLEEIDALAGRADQAFRAALDDDLNISGALAQVHGFVKASYKVLRSREAGERAARQLESWDRVLGVLEYHEGNRAPEEEDSATGGLSDDEVDRLVAERREARARRDFAEADRLRDLLRETGVVIKDSPDRTVWHREL